MVFAAGGIFGGGDDTGFSRFDPVTFAGTWFSPDEPALTAFGDCIRTPDLLTNDGTEGCVGVSFEAAELEEPDGVGGVEVTAVILFVAVSRCL